MCRKFLFQENDTKINDFDEGVLILEPFCSGNVIVIIEVSRLRYGGISLSSSPECNPAKLRKECHSSFMLSSFYKSRIDTLPGGAKQWEILGTTIVTFEMEVIYFENDIASEKRP